MFKNSLRLGGYFTVSCYDVNGILKWTEKTHNIVTNEGLNHVLNVYLHGTSAIGIWYCTMFENNYTPLAGDTYAIPGYTECTAYDEATRPIYVEGAASGQFITNSSNKAVFTINNTKTLYGASLVGGGTDPTIKGNTAGGGILFCAAKFSSSRGVIASDVINLTYTISATDDGV